MSSLLDQTYSVILSLQRALTPNEVCEQLTNFSGRYGLTSVLAGTCPAPKAHKKKQEEHIFAWSYPSEWMDRYLERRYALIDPIISRLQADLSPFVWSESMRFVPPDNVGAVQTMMGEAAEHHLSAGIVIPMLTLDGDVAAVSIGGERLEVPPESLGMLNLVSSYAMARAIELRNIQAIRREVNITPRELECLRWAADGKNEWEISTILCISEHTADKHLSNARAKLGAVNRTQAVARALRLGLLS
jgi:LuxR family transcriptional regulator, quorum-sensing system regulator BjaR1